MPIKQRCTKCKKFVAYGVKSCSCGGRVGESVFLVAKVKGKRLTKNLKVCSLSKARTEEHKWLLEVHNGVEKSSELLSEIFTDYLDKLRAEGKKYVRLVTLFLQRMLDYFGDIEAADLRPPQIKRFQTYLREAGYSPAYCDRHIAMGKAAWNYSLETPNPFKRVALYNPDNTLVRFLSPEEEANLLEAARNSHPNAPPLYDFILIAMHTGLREANIMDLKVSEIDFDSGSITVTQKGGKKHTVAMNRIVRDLLLPRVVDAPRSGWLFPNPLTRKPYTRLDKSFNSAKKRAGITRPFRFHDLRHHFGTKVLRATGNLRMTQLLMGHSNPKTTTRYAHLILEDQQRAVDLLVTHKDPGYIEGSPLQNEDDKLLN